MILIYIQILHTFPTSLHNTLFIQAPFFTAYFTSLSLSNCDCTRQIVVIKSGRPEQDCCS